jgi:hypothetical protein
MAYQPIHIGRPGVFDAMSDVGNSLAELGDIRRQRQRERLEQERQQRGGFANAYMQAQALMHKGDFDGARMLLAPYSKDVQVGREEISPSMPMSTEGQQPQGGSAMPDQLEMSSDARVRDPNEVLTERMGHAPQASDYTGAVGPRGMPMLQVASPMLNDTETVEQMAKTEHPLFAARKAEVAKEAKRYKTLLRGIGPDGQAFTMDPEAQREAELQEAHSRIAPIEQAVTDSGDEVAIGAFRQIKPWLLSGKDTGQAFTFINDAKEMQAKTAAAVAAERRRVGEKQDDREYAKTDWAEKNKITSGQSDRRMATQAAILAGREGVKEEEKKISREVLDDKGNVIGEARTDDEAKDARTARTALEKARTVAQDLKAQLKDGRLVPFFQSGKEADRALIISQLTELRKQITGAETAADAAKYQTQLSTAWNRGPEEAMAAVDQFVRGAEVGYNATARSIMRRGTGGADQRPAAKPANKILDARAVDAARSIVEGDE